MEPDYRALTLEIALTKLESETAELDSADTPVLREHIATLTARVEDLEQCLTESEDRLALAMGEAPESWRGIAAEVLEHRRESKSLKSANGHLIHDNESLQRENAGLREDKARLDWASVMFATGVTNMEIAVAIGKERDILGARSIIDAARTSTATEAENGGRGDG